MINNEIKQLKILRESMEQIEEGPGAVKFGGDVREVLLSFLTQQTSTTRFAKYSKKRQQVVSSVIAELTKGATISNELAQSILPFLEAKLKTANYFSYDTGAIEMAVDAIKGATSVKAESMGNVQNIEEGPSESDSKVLADLKAIAMTFSADDSSDEWEQGVHDILKKYGITVPEIGSDEYEDFWDQM